MFTLQIHTLNSVVLNAFADVFKLLAASPTASIAYEDRPDVGRDTITQNAIGAGGNCASAAAVFIPSAPAVAPPPVAQDAAAVFAPLAPPPPNVTGGVTFHMQAPLVDQASTSLQLAPPPAASSSAANVLVDSTGLPWDARIHAGTKTQTAKAVWKAKKGVDDALIAQVTAELRQLMAIPVKPFVPLNAPEAPAAPQAPQAPPPPTTASAPAGHQPSAIVPTNFVEMCQYIEARKLNATVVLSICQKHGLPGLGLLTQRPDLIKQIHDDFQAL